MKQVHGMKALTAFVIMVMALVSGSAMGASIPNFLLKGWIGSGKVETADKDLLRVPHVWKYSGAKNSRAVIAVVVEDGTALPDMLLFAPGKSECVARAQAVDPRSMVIDTTLEESGDYMILIRPKAGEKWGGYRLALAEIPTLAEYRILPDDAGGKVIQADTIIVEKDDPSMVLKGGLLILTPFMVLPQMVASIGFHAYAIVGSTINLINVPGYQLYDRIVHNDGGQASPSGASVSSR